MTPPHRRIGPFVDVDFALRRQFSKTSFRHPQREIIESALEGYDVVVLAATGFGKSLCFQLPAVIDCGVTVVVSPLLSLMINQVGALRKANIDARTLNGYTSAEERMSIYRDLASAHPRTRLLYVTPELCSSSRFRQRIQLVHEQRELARVVIDEAHCISEWGHDFRRDFIKLGWFRQSFPDVPIMCLTATATEPVLDDVLGTLGIGLQNTPATRRRASQSQRLKIFRLSPFRPNLFLVVRFVSSNEEGEQDRLADFVAWLHSLHRKPLKRKRRLLVHASQSQDAETTTPPSVPGIIYTLSRNECECLASALRQKGIGARPFHAQLSREVKEETMAKWLKDDPGYAVIVATTAFGMGVDKENVRFVVHWRLPKSFEGYCQEIGRAGRDSRPATCILYYSRGDGERVSNLVARSGARAAKTKHQAARRASLSKLIEYCEATDKCRHAAVCQYFGLELDQPCDYACDWHRDPQGVRRRKEECLSKE